MYSVYSNTKGQRMMGAAVGRDEGPGLRTRWAGAYMRGSSAATFPGNGSTGVRTPSDTALYMGCQHPKYMLNELGHSSTTTLATKQQNLSWFSSKTEEKNMPIDKVHNPI